MRIHWKTILAAIACFVSGGFVAATLLAGAIILAVDKIQDEPVPNYSTAALDPPALAGPDAPMTERFVAAVEA